jgi:hypothetical protein
MPHPDFKTNTMTTGLYADSVSALIKMARQDCSGSRVCAQVLLSAYNGSEFQLDITDLCLLDETYYNCAMIVIRGRVETRIEPHELIKDGSLVFEQLWNQWRGYHVANRFKTESAVFTEHF